MCSMMWSVDPMLYSLPERYLLDPQEQNSYAYARNNPIVYTDPTGMFSAIGTMLNMVKSAVNGAKSYVNNVVFRNTSNSGWANNFANAVVATAQRYVSNPTGSARSDYSSASSAASAYGSSLKTNVSQILNANTIAQGDAAMNGPAGSIIKTVATFGAAKLAAAASDIMGMSNGMKSVSNSIRGVAAMSRSELSEGAASSLNSLEAKGWKVNRPGVANGKSYSNNNDILPTNTNYKEFDVNSNNIRPNRDQERFILGDNGSIYYTNNHFGDVLNFEPAFYKLI